MATIFKFKYSMNMFSIFIDQHIDESVVDVCDGAIFVCCTFDTKDGITSKWREHIFCTGYETTFGKRYYISNDRKFAVVGVTGKNVADVDTVILLENAGVILRAKKIVSFNGSTHESLIGSVPEVEHRDFQCTPLNAEDFLPVEESDMFDFEDLKCEIKRHCSKMEDIEYRKYLTIVPSHYDLLACCINFARHGGVIDFDEWILIMQKQPLCHDVKVAVLSSFCGLLKDESLEPKLSEFALSHMNASKARCLFGSSMNRCIDFIMKESTESMTRMGAHKLLN